MKLIVSLRDPNANSVQGFPPELPISLIVIDNISTFLWRTTVSGTAVREYTALGALLRKMQRELGCSVITTSWDNNYTVLPVPDDARSDKRQTGIPKQYFQFIDHSYNISKKGQRSNQVTVKYEASEAGHEASFNDQVI